MTTPDGPLAIKTWEREHAMRVVASINATRDRLGWTIPTLRGELVKLGWNISTETLNGILSAKKRGSFSVGEIFAFARALGVAPIFLLLGMPDGSDLPAGPLMADEPDIASAYQWIADAEVRVLDSSPLALFARYSEHLTLTKWHNALWIESGGSLGKSSMEEDLRQLIFWRGRWRHYAESGYFVPDLPALPPALAALDLDNLSDPPQLTKPLADFSGSHWTGMASAYWAGIQAAEKNMRENKEELERMLLQAGGAQSGSTTNPAE
jgi:hypothetical protein